MTWILLVMLAMIVGSVVVEWILPMSLKETLGAAICWGMMAVTMTFLAGSTAGLLWIIATRIVAPMLSA